MSKYSLGTWFVTAGMATILGYNVNIVTGIATMFVVMGIAYMISGMLESVLKILVANFKG